MKKLVFTALIALVSTGVFAQGGRQQRHNFTAEQMADLHTKKMALNLDLNESQQKKVYDLNLDQAEDRKKMKAERKAMRESDKKPTSDEVYKKKSELLDKMIAYKTEMKKVLTPEQYEKWEKTMKRKGKKGKHNKRKGNRGRDRR